jgi:hypothetical protein
LYSTSLCSKGESCINTIEAQQEKRRLHLGALGGMSSKIGGKRNLEESRDLLGTHWIHFWLLLQKEEEYTQIR